MPPPASCESSAVLPQELSFWRIVVLSLRGKRHDYTSIPLNRAVLLLAVPMVIEMIMESMFALVNVLWISRLGTDAVAVIGLTESVMTLVYAIAVGMAMAATAIVARRIGEDDPEGAARAAGQIVLIGAALSVGMGLVLGGFAPGILRLMGAEESVVTLGSDFARLMLGCSATAFLIFLINAIFRGAGDAVLAMRTLWLANALNIVLGPCLIFGWGPFPELGILGAAVATNIGRGVGVLYQLWHLIGARGRVRLRLRHLRPIARDLRTITATASSGIAQLLIATTSWVGLFKIMALFGSAALAGFTIAMRIVVFALMPAAGLANAGATLVGQSLGAGSAARADAAVRIATRFNVIFLAAVGAVFVMMARPLVSLFTNDAEALDYGTRALWIVSLALPLYAVGISRAAAFNGAGDTRTPARLNFFCFWLAQVPIAWTLAHVLGLGPMGVFVAVPVSFSILALWIGVLFDRGRWKQQKI